MNNTPHSNHSKSWIKRITDALLREPQDREQLLNLLEDAHDRHLLSYDALVMIEGVLQFSEMHVRDIMIPRSQAVMIDSEQTPQQALPLIIDSAHSRFPVYDQEKDEVIGILLAKDLLNYVFGMKEASNIKDITRPAIFVPESKRLDILLQEFRLNRNHMAMVADEYGSTIGLVTIEDVLEQIVGDIGDEYDEEITEQNITAISADLFTAKGLTPIEEFNQFFNTHLDDTQFDTIGGFVAATLGHVPTNEERLTLENLKLKVLEASDRQLQLLEIKQIN